MNTQELIKFLNKTNAKCSVCGNSGFTVETANHVINALVGLQRLPSIGIPLLIATCNKCSNLITFVAHKKLD